MTVWPYLSASVCGLAWAGVIFGVVDRGVGLVGAVAASVVHLAVSLAVARRQVHGPTPWRPAR